MVLMYRLETGVMTPHIGKVLGGFHPGVTHRLTGRQPHIWWDG